jgi:hypothetical protein
MKVFRFCLLGFCASLATAALAFSPPAGDRNDAPLVVHEWGTFLTMNGSDGVVLDSMYHEEHALPGFVHAVSEDQLRDSGVLLKGETPVIYFYTQRPRTVHVQVKFPRGIWTQWYPQAYVLDRRDDDQSPISEEPGEERGFGPLHGCISWDADLIPADNSHPAPALPQTPPNSLWNFARQVDAAYVSGHSDNNWGSLNETGKREAERFLFYRGLGQAKLPLAVDSSNGGSISLPSGQGYPLTGLFVLRVEGGKGAYRYIPALQPGQSLNHIIPDMKDAQPAADFSAHVADDLAARLEENGLYAKEARAMVNTWRSSYFQSPGVRVLYILPQRWTDDFIPLRVTPAPDKIVRVMVGRTELLTPAREREIVQALRDLNAKDPGARVLALALLRAQGRYIQPILRRTLRLSSDPVVSAACRRLLKADWVNEIHAPPVTSASTR